MSGFQSHQKCLNDLSAIVFMAMSAWNCNLDATLRVESLAKEQWQRKILKADETFILLFLVSENFFLKESSGTRDHTVAMCWNQFKKIRCDAFNLRPGWSAVMLCQALARYYYHQFQVERPSMLFNRSRHACQPRQVATDCHQPRWFRQPYPMRRSGVRRKVEG